MLTIDHVSISCCAISSNTRLRNVHRRLFCEKVLAGTAAIAEFLLVTGCTDTVPTTAAVISRSTGVGKSVLDFSSFIISPPSVRKHHMEVPVRWRLPEVRSPGSQHVRRSLSARLPAYKSVRQEPDLWCRS